MVKRNKYEIGLGSDEDEKGSNRTEHYSLSRWNQLIEDAYGCYVRGEVLPEEFLPENMWNEWLWGFDPTEQCNIECLMNRSHLLGLLLARYRGIYQSRYRTSNNTIAEFLGTQVTHKICLFDCPINTYTLRHLRDTVQNIQLNWIECTCACIPNMKNTINALFHRFGTLALQGGGVEEMNDQGSVEDATGGLLRMNRICLRRFINTFMIMYRHIHFNEHMEVPHHSGEEWFDCSIKKHHLTASTDDFNAIAMHWDIMMASKLNYIHDFPGR
jgi:hypothetical protein